MNEEILKKYKAEIIDIKVNPNSYINYDFTRKYKIYSKEYKCKYVYRILNGTINAEFCFSNESELYKNLDNIFEINNIIDELENKNKEIDKIIEKMSPKYSYSEWINSSNSKNSNIDTNIDYFEIWKNNLNKPYNKDIKTKYVELVKNKETLLYKIHIQSSINDMIVNKEMNVEGINNWKIKII